MPDTPDLTALRDAASVRAPIDTDDRSILGVPLSSAMDYSDAAYIVALVNAHASGDLVPAAELCALREVAEAAEALNISLVGTGDVPLQQWVGKVADARQPLRAALARYHALKGADNAE